MWQRLLILHLFLGTADRYWMMGTTWMTLADLSGNRFTRRAARSHRPRNCEHGNCTAAQYLTVPTLIVPQSWHCLLRAGGCCGVWCLCFDPVIEALHGGGAASTSISYYCCHRYCVTPSSLSCAELNHPCRSRPSGIQSPARGAAEAKHAAQRYFRVTKLNYPESQIFEATSASARGYPPLIRDH